MHCLSMYFIIFADAPPNLCLSKDCTNAAGCTLDSDNAAICFCDSGYKLLANDTCVSKSHPLYRLLARKPVLGVCEITKSQTSLRICAV